MEILAVVLVGAVISLLIDLVGAFIVMVAMGIIHNDVSHAVPALGFGACFGLVVAFSLVVTVVKFLVRN